MANLKGFKSYDVWAQDMANMLKYDGLWGTISGKEHIPTLPTPPKAPQDGRTTPTTSSEDKEYRAELKHQTEELNKWNMRNDKACALFMLTADARPRVHIQKLENAAEIWNTLQK